MAAQAGHKTEHEQLSNTCAAEQQLQGAVDPSTTQHDTEPVGGDHTDVQLAPGEVWATEEQSAAAEAGELKLVDVAALADRFRSSLQTDRFAYVNRLSATAPQSKLAVLDSECRLPPNVHPSVLQHKLCSGANRLSSTLLPTSTADGLLFHNLPTPSSTRATAGQLQPHLQPQHNQQSTATPRSTVSTNNQPWQFSMGLLKATHVGPTGFQGQRQPIYHVARIAILDKGKNRLLGNVHTVPATEVRSKGLTWCWGPEGPSRTLAGSELPRPEFIPPGQLAGSPAAVAAAAASAGLLDGLTEGPGTFPNLGGDLAGAGGANSFIVRCGKEARDPVSGLRQLDGDQLSLYIELNVAFRLTAADVEVVPQADGKGRGVVSELTTCWALVSLKRCAELTREMDISVPLYTGSIYQPGLLSAVWAADRKLHPIRSMLTSAPAPQLTFRVGPLQAAPQPLLPYNLLPLTCIARRNVGYLLATAQLAMSQQLTAATGGLAGINGNVIQGFGDAALAALPALLDDPLLLGELMSRWWGRCRGLVAAAEQRDKVDGLLSSCSCVNNSSPPTHAQLITALKASILELSPLLHCSNMPADHMTNFIEHQQHRAQVAAKFLRVLDPKTGRQVSAGAGGGGRHSVDVLSNAAGEFLHEPFDVAETKVCVSNQLQAFRWSRC